MPGRHRYELTVEWTGNRGQGTASYRAYDRDHDIRADGVPTIAGSSDPHFYGDRSRWNPEQLLLAAAAECHMLAYLHHAAVNGVVVVAYTDEATGEMTEDGRGGGRFTDITLHPTVTVADASMIEAAERLHADANRDCFIVSSLNLPVGHDVRTVVA